MSYGEGDYNLTGDDVTSHVLWSPTTVYIGDGTEDGFDSVVVSNFFYFLEIPTSCFIIHFAIYNSYKVLLRLF